MRTLIVEDDATNRLLLQSFLSECGECLMAVNGKEAVESFRGSQKSGQVNDLICMGIMKPEMDGHTRSMARRSMRTYSFQLTASKGGESRDFSSTTFANGDAIQIITEVGWYKLVAN